MSIYWTEDQRAAFFNGDEDSRVTTHVSCNPVDVEDEGRLTLDDCLRRFMTKESLTQENAWYVLTPRGVWHLSTH